MPPRPFDSVCLRGPPAHLAVDVADLADLGFDKSCRLDVRAATNEANGGGGIFCRSGGGTFGWHKWSVGRETRLGRVVNG